MATTSERTPTKAPARRAPAKAPATVVGALGEAAERIREAGHLALREPPSLEDVAARLGELRDLVGELQQHLDSGAGSLVRAARRPGLRSADAAEDPRVVAGVAAFRLQDLCLRYASGLETELGAAHAEVAGLSAAVDGEEGDAAS